MGYAALSGGGGAPRDWSISVLILGIAGLVCSGSLACGNVSSRLGSIAFWAAPAFCAYVAFQLVPLPSPLLRLASPTRVEIAAALGVVTSAARFVPLTVGPAATVLYGSRIVAYTLVFFFARETARRSTTNRWLPALPILAIGVVETAWGLAQHVAGIDAISGTYGDRDLFAGLLEIALPFSITYAIAAHPRRDPGDFSPLSVLKSTAGLVSAAGTFVAIIFSLSRMGFVSALVSLFVMAILGISSRVSGRSKWLAMPPLLVLGLLIFVFVPSNNFIERFSTLAAETTTEGRWPVWKDTAHLIAAYPLFGSGLGNYLPSLLRYQTASLSLSWAFAHNDYLQLLSEVGVLGCGILATLMVAAFVSALRTVRAGATRDTYLLGLACAGALTAVLVHSLTSFNAYIPANAMAVAWTAGVSAGLSIRSDRDCATARMFIPRKIVLPVASGLIVYGCAWLVFLNAFRADLHAEQLFCRFGICDTQGALAAERFLHGGTTAAIPPARVAEFLRRDPAGPYAWCDFGESLQKAGRIGEARFCFSRALELGPNIPFMLFRAANFYFDEGESKKALGLMARASEGDPNYSDAAFDVYAKRRIRVDDVLRDGLANRAAGEAYLRKFLSQRDASATTVWKSLLTRGWVDDKLAADYVNTLIQSRDYDSAAHSWADYVGVRCRDYLKSTFVFNGEFELDPTRSPFDWQLWDRSGVTVGIDPRLGHSGHKSARLSFDGTENVGSIDLSQTAFVPPGRYKLQAYIKTEGLTTDQGVAFGVSATGFDVTTESIRKATDWRLVEKELQVPPNAGLVQVRVFRRPSLKFDNQIKGTVWIDDVKIIPESVK